MCVETLLNNVQIKGSSGGGERGTMWHSIRIWELCCYFLSYHPNLYKSLLILLLLDTNMPSFKKQMLRISFMPFLIVAFITNNRKIINRDQMLGEKKVSTSYNAAQDDEWQRSHQMHISMVTELCKLCYSVRLKCKCYLVNAFPVKRACHKLAGLTSDVREL